MRLQHRIRPAYRAIEVQNIKVFIGILSPWDRSSMGRYAGPPHPPSSGQRRAWTRRGRAHSRQTSSVPVQPPRACTLLKAPLPTKRPRRPPGANEESPQPIPSTARNDLCSPSYGACARKPHSTGGKLPLSISPNGRKSASQASAKPVEAVLADVAARQTNHAHHAQKKVQQPAMRPPVCRVLCTSDTEHPWLPISRNTLWPGEPGVLCALFR